LGVRNFDQGYGKGLRHYHPLQDPPSFPRRRESKVLDGAEIMPGLRLWIPACAGMTDIDGEKRTSETLRISHYKAEKSRVLSLLFAHRTRVPIDQWSKNEQKSCYKVALS
jgi:hypothetical protein